MWVNIHNFFSTLLHSFCSKFSAFLAKHKKNTYQWLEANLYAIFLSFSFFFHFYVMFVSAFFSSHRNKNICEWHKCSRNGYCWVSVWAQLIKFKNRDLKFFPHIYLCNNHLKYHSGKLILNTKHTKESTPLTGSGSKKNSRSKIKGHWEIFLSFILFRIAQRKQQTFMAVRIKIYKQMKKKNSWKSKEKR